MNRLLAVFVFTGTMFAQTMRDFTIPAPVQPGSVIVLGFLGGFEPWNREQSSVRKLILELRDQPGVFADTMRNQRRALAVGLVRRALDRNHDGRIEPSESAGTRIILVGQSWGAAAVVATARDLNRLGIPVLLTVQVDSVGKRDSLIPPNVASAVNFSQHDPLTITGQREIHAADPARTRILGNFEYSYVGKPAADPSASWSRRKLGGGHAKMEMDPEVWARAKNFILEAITSR